MPRVGASEVREGVRGSSSRPRRLQSSGVVVGAGDGLGADFGIARDRWRRVVRHSVFATVSTGADHPRGEQLSTRAAAQKMGEGSELLEEMMDLFPAVPELPRRQAAADSGDGAGNSASAPFEYRAAPALPRTISPDISPLHAYSYMLGADQDGEIGILAGHNVPSSWSAEPQEEGPGHASSHLAPDWEEWSHDSRILDEPCASGNHHPGAPPPRADERHLQRDAGVSFEVDSVSADGAMRRSARERKRLNRFDPVAAAPEKRLGGRCAPAKHAPLGCSAMAGVDDEFAAAGEGSGKGTSAASAASGRTQQLPAQSCSKSTGPSLSKGAMRAGSRKRAETARMERGKHVGSKPQMQKTARAGQKKWKEVLTTLRDDVKKWSQSKDFEKQMNEVRACSDARALD